jgi:hypothetical protein
VTAALASLIFGLSNGQQHGFRALATIVALVAAVVLAVAFGLVESKEQAPMLPLSIFAAGSRCAAVVALVMIGAVLAGYVYFVSLYLQKVQHFSPLLTGLALVPSTLTVVAMSTLGTRRLLARLPAWQVLLTGLGCLAAGQLWLAQISDTATYPAVVLPGLILTSMGIGLALPTASIAITSGVARTAQADGSLVAGYRLSFLISAGIIVFAAITVAVQMHPRVKQDANLHQPSPDGIPAVSPAECQLRNC